MGVKGTWTPKANRGSTLSGIPVVAQWTLNSAGRTSATFGFNTAWGIGLEGAYTDVKFNKLLGMGGKVVRETLQWDTIELTDEVYTWPSAINSMVIYANANNVETYIHPSTYNQNSLPMGNCNGRIGPILTSTQQTKYGSFCSAAATQYNGVVTNRTIRSWAADNEPWTYDHTFTPVSAAMYYTYQDILSTNVKAVSASNKAYGASQLDPDWPGDAWNLQFRTDYNAGLNVAGRDGYDFHEYENADNSLNRTPEQMIGYMAENINLALAARAACPITISEFGFFTRGSGAVSEAVQAEYYSRLLFYIRGSQVDRAIIYSLFDRGAASDATNSWGMYLSDKVTEKAAVAVITDVLVHCHAATAAKRYTSGNFAGVAMTSATGRRYALMDSTGTNTKDVNIYCAAGGTLSQQIMGGATDTAATLTAGYSVVTLTAGVTSRVFTCNTEFSILEMPE